MPSQSPQCPPPPLAISTALLHPLLTASSNPNASAPGSALFGLGIWLEEWDSVRKTPRFLEHPMEMCGSALCFLPQGSLTSMGLVTILIRVRTSSVAAAHPPSPKSSWDTGEMLRAEVGRRSPEPLTPALVRFVPNEPDMLGVGVPLSRGRYFQIVAGTG